MTWTEQTEHAVARGIAFFKEGYNCTQSVTLALAEEYGVEPALMARISASFGAGMGRMRETCGTVSGMFLLCGLETATPFASPVSKAQNYTEVQALAARFKAETGSLICRELLAGHVKQIQTTPVPDARTDDYYRRRPCIRMVELAIRTYMAWLEDYRARQKSEAQ